MKTIIKILVMSMVLQGCQSQSDFDLTEVKLNEQKVNEIVADEGSFNFQELSDKGPFYASSKSEKFLIFNGVGLAGRIDPESQRARNGLNLYYSKNDSIVNKYQIFIYTYPESEKLLNTLMDKFGSPDYSHYKSAEAKASDNFDALIWEDQNNNRLYLLKYSPGFTQKANLEVKVNSSDPKILNLHGSFSYWDDYLYERNKKDENGYTYQMFLEEEKAKDPDAFIVKKTK